MNTKADLYRLAWALASIMDGMSSHDIAGVTGLQEEECNLINEIRNDALILVRFMHWKKPE